MVLHPSRQPPSGVPVHSLLGTAGRHLPRPLPLRGRRRGEGPPPEPRRPERGPIPLLLEPVPALITAVPLAGEIAALRVAVLHDRIPVRRQAAAAAAGRASEAAPRGRQQRRWAAKVAVGRRRLPITEAAHHHPAAARGVPVVHRPPIPMHRRLAAIFNHLGNDKSKRHQCSKSLLGNRRLLLRLRLPLLLGRTGTRLLPAAATTV